MPRHVTSHGDGVKRKAKDKTKAGSMTVKVNQKEKESQQARAQEKGPSNSPGQSHSGHTQRKQIGTTMRSGA